MSSLTAPRRGVATWVIVAAVSGCGGDETPAPEPADPLLEQLGRCVQFNPLRDAYFGDTHVHTALSLDANLQGARLSPADAYRFARGAELGIQPYDADGQPLRTLKLSRALDFVALSDHAEFLGLVRACTDPDSPEYDDPVCAGYRSDPDVAYLTLNVNLASGQDLSGAPAPCSDADGGCSTSALDAWSEVREAAEAAYDRSSTCSFTSFVAYEWSASPGALNLHRNVVFRNHRVPRLPFSYFDGGREEQLWQALRDECLDAAGACDALTIPHNSNLSSGLMFETVDSDGQPIDEDYARTRAALEPLVEIFQHKGDSECMPGVLSSDELCDFEKVPYTSLASANLGGDPDPLVESDFVRHALGRGLELGASLGTNPYQYGFIASTDTHLGTPGAVEESRFVGHGGAGLTVRDVLPPGLPDRPWFNPGGLAVLWAEENSREALFEAMRRREAYATSGTRIMLRFFGGWSYPADLCQRTDLAEVGYQQGVPMGSVLSGGNGASPTFVVSALRDAGTADRPGTALQRVEIIKGWLEAGQARFTVYPVAGDPLNGASVDTATCQPQGAGADSLCASWTDPDFNPDAPAFYYARVVENPTCRWQTYLCNAALVDCGDPATVTEGFEGCCDFPATQQERAWSSPIWYAR